VSVLRNPRLIDDLADEINEQKQEIKELKIEKSSLNEIVESLRDDAFYLNEITDEILEQKNLMLGSMDKMLDLAVRANLNLEKQDNYNRLSSIDPEGWCIYRASQELLKVDVYREFIVEDSMGMFEESNGHELKKYVEIAAFGECTYKITSGIHEVLDSYAIDYSSQKYKDYLEKLYPLAIHKLVEKLYEIEPSEKLTFLQRHMERLSKDTIEKGNVKLINPAHKDIEGVVENEMKEVVDEEMEI